MPQLGTPAPTPTPRYVSPASASIEVPALMDNCTHNTGNVFGTICGEEHAHRRPDHNADST